jgi:hypothetical protein
MPLPAEILNAVDILGDQHQIDSVNAFRTGLIGPLFVIGAGLKPAPTAS